MRKAERAPSLACGAPLTPCCVCWCLGGRPRCRGNCSAEPTFATSTHDDRYARFAHACRRPTHALLRKCTELSRSMGNGRRHLLTEGASATVTWLTFFSQQQLGGASQLTEVLA